MFAQFPHPERETMAAMVIMVAACLWIANQVKTLLAKKDDKPSAEDRPIRKAELEREVAAINKDVAEIKGLMAERIAQVGKGVALVKTVLVDRIATVEKSQTEASAAGSGEVGRLRQELHHMEVRIMERMGAADSTLARLAALIEKGQEDDR